MMRLILSGLENRLLRLAIVARINGVDGMSIKQLREADPSKLGRLRLDAVEYIANYLMDNGFLRYQDGRYFLTPLGEQTASKSMPLPFYGFSTDHGTLIYTKTLLPFGGFHPDSLGIPRESLEIWARNKWIVMDEEELLYWK